MTLNKYITTVVIVGLTQPVYVVTEGETVTVCAQLQSGQLERDAAVFFTTSSDLGMYVHDMYAEHKPAHSFQALISKYVEKDCILLAFTSNKLLQECHSIFIFAIRQYYMIKVMNN